MKPFGYAKYFSPFPELLIKVAIKIRPAVDARINACRKAFRHSGIEVKKAYMEKIKRKISVSQIMNRPAAEQSVV